jgi:hypothetical protein
MKPERMSCAQQRDAIRHPPTAHIRQQPCSALYRAWTMPLLALSR